MTLKTCLLITDDPDDHQAFTEALSEISAKAIVLNVVDSEKALDFLKIKKHTPDYIFIDLSMHGIRINSFLKAVKSDIDLSLVPTVVYGQEKDFIKIENPEKVVFFIKDYEYSHLRDFLKNFIKPSEGKNGI